MGPGIAHAEDQPPASVCSILLSIHITYTNRNRKRAKTEDEKEQRRIERVLRNRQAAQSSRERKRQEVEKLEGEKSFIETQNDRLKERLLQVEHEKFKLQQENTKLAAELAALKGGSSSSRASLAPSPNLAAQVFNQQAIKQELEESLYSLRTPISLPSDSFSPSPSASSNSRSPSPTSLGLGFHALTTSPDMTQHPAAMLCDLQCQSGADRSVAMTRPTTRATTLSTTSNPPASNLITRMSQSFLAMLAATVFTQLHSPLLQISLSLKTASPLPTQTMTHPTSLLLIRWLILTPTDLTRSSTTTTPSTTATTSSRTTTPSRPTFRIRLLRRLLLCSPALARPLLGATVRAMRAERGAALVERKAKSRGVGSEKSWSRLMMLALAIECITKEMEKGRICKTKDRGMGRGRAMYDGVGAGDNQLKLIA